MRSRNSRFTYFYFTYLPAVLVVTMAVRCAACAVDFVNCYTPDAFIKLKMHENLLSAGTSLGVVGGAS